MGATLTIQMSVRRTIRLVLVALSLSLVPATAFAEPSREKDETGKTPSIWFARDLGQPLFFFAGLWTPWHGVRRVRDREAREQQHAGEQPAQEV